MEPIVHKLLSIPSELRSKVKEVTLDMAGSMKTIISKCFVNAIQVTDRFHVQKLANEALQDIRVQERWKALDIENSLILQAKKEGRTFIDKEFENGDTARQLLIRSRYLLAMDATKWTINQQQRAKILFKEYPLIYQAYTLTQKLRDIYNRTTIKAVAYTKLAHWYNDIQVAGLKQFSSVINTIQINYRTILNYFDNRSTNASAESFNAKIKAFRAQFRGVRDINFFLYRLMKLFA